MATATARGGEPGGAGAGTAPRQASLVLLALIVVAAVANLNLTVANVALPDIGRAFDTGQGRASPPEVRVRRDFPHVEQPLGNVVPISVALAPGA